MLVSAREAAVFLEDAGLCRRQARRVLASGLAGAPLRTRSSLLFDADRVRDLVAWPVADAAAVDAACPWGIFISRRQVDVGAEAADQLASVREDWPLNQLTRVFLGLRIRRHGYFPFVATVSGYVALGAEIVGGSLRRGNAVFDLQEPGEWFEVLRGRQFPSGPGRPWVIRGWQLYARMGESGT